MAACGLPAVTSASGATLRLARAMVSAMRQGGLVDRELVGDSCVRFTGVDAPANEPRQVERR
jgi:hypothetical protein